MHAEFILSRDLEPGLKLTSNGPCYCRCRRAYNLPLATIHAVSLVLRARFVRTYESLSLFLCRSRYPTHRPPRLPTHVDACAPFDNGWDHNTDSSRLAGRASCVDKLFASQSSLEGALHAGRTRLIPGIAPQNAERFTCFSLTLDYSPDAKYPRFHFLRVAEGHRWLSALFRGSFNLHRLYPIFRKNP